MYDTIIVGAGSAGCVLANRLSADPARKVLLLEAGRDAPIASDVPSDWPTLFNTAADWGYYTEAQAGCRGRRVFWPRGKMIGGSGAMNAMIYIRGLPSDYDGWSKLGCSGWAWNDVFPVFKASEGNVELGNDSYHGAHGPLHIGNVAYVDPNELKWIEACKAAGYPFNRDFNGAKQEGVGLFQFTIKDGERWSTGKAYLRPALERPNLTVKKDVLATGVIIDNGRATGIRYLVNGVPETALADSEVVLSSGSIGSCQLMLLSGIGPAEELREVGVDCVHDLPGVGKSLQDHINIPITFYTNEKIGVGAWTDESLERDFNQWQSSRTGPRSSPWVAAGGFIKSRPDIEPDLQLYGAISSHRDYVRFLSSKPGITLHTTLQRPDSRGEIRLRSANPVEHPFIDPRYFISDDDGSDIATLVEGIRISRRIAAQSPLKELIEGEITPSVECESDAEIAEYIRGHCTTLYHPTSTCRMGIDSASVVDPATMKVHGLEGLHIADASVFPKMVSGNTNAPTIMIAERASSMIINK
ncbi:MAG: choline dehydrogenase [Gammaproteobacteria bacterium]|jgi:choline dehydrogenase